MANRIKVGGLQIFLTEMDAVSLVLDGQTPVVVDKQAGLMAMAKSDGRRNVGFDLVILFIFDAQLERFNANLQQAFNPRHAVHDRV
ncbi:hypothetical protein D3C75_1033920 [compost metagenome]